MATRTLAGLALLSFAGLAVASSPPVRIEPTTVLAHEQELVRLPAFSPDSRTLAYAVDLHPRQLPYSEVRTLTLAGGRRRTLLPWGESKREGATFASSLQWLDGGRLKVRLSDGDVGQVEFTLDRDRTGAIASTYTDFSDEAAAPRADPALAALVPAWKPEALDTAVARALPVPGRGMVVQKSYAGEDHHVWWLDTQAGKARVLVPQKKGERSELRGGFDFAGQAMFALREGTAVNVYVLGADGTLRRVPDAGIATIPGGESIATAVGTSIGELKLRRCGAEACWARLDLHHNDWTQVQVLRLDRDGNVEIVGGLPGLEDFDVSPDLRWLAATRRDGERRQLQLFRVLAF